MRPDSFRVHPMQKGMIIPPMGKRSSFIPPFGYITAVPTPQRLTLAPLGADIRPQYFTNSYVFSLTGQLST